MWIYDCDTGQPIRQITKAEAGRLFAVMRAEGLHEYVHNPDSTCRIVGMSGELVGYEGSILLPDWTAMEDGDSFGDDDFYSGAEPFPEDGAA